MLMCGLTAGDKAPRHTRRKRGNSAPRKIKKRKNWVTKLHAKLDVARGTGRGAGQAAQVLAAPALLGLA